MWRRDCIKKRKGKKMRLGRGWRTPTEWRTSFYCSFSPNCYIRVYLSRGCAAKNKVFLLKSIFFLSAFCIRLFFLLEGTLVSLPKLSEKGIWQKDPLLHSCCIYKNSLSADRRVEVTVKRNPKFELAPFY